MLAIYSLLSKPRTLRDSGSTIIQEVTRRREDALTIMGQQWKCKFYNWLNENYHIIHEEASFSKSYHTLEISIPNLFGEEAVVGLIEGWASVVGVYLWSQQLKLNSWTSRGGRELVLDVSVMYSFT